MNTIKDNQDKIEQVVDQLSSEINYSSSLEEIPIDKYYQLKALSIQQSIRLNGGGKSELASKTGELTELNQQLGEVIAQVNQKNNQIQAGVRQVDQQIKDLDKKSKDYSNALKNCKNIKTPTEIDYSSQSQDIKENSDQIISELNQILEISLQIEATMNKIM